MNYAYYFDTKINVRGVSVNGRLGEVGGEDKAPPGRFCCRGFPARDICPNRYNNSQKTHSKFSNCKALLCDYFPPYIQCVAIVASLARRDVFIDPLLSLTYHLFHFELVPILLRVVPNRSQNRILSRHNIINSVKFCLFIVIVTYFARNCYKRIRCQKCFVGLRDNRIT